MSGPAPRPTASTASPGSSDPTAEADMLPPGLSTVEWTHRETSGRFHRRPPKGGSYRSTNVEPVTPVDLPPFLAGLLAAQAGKHARQRCTCAAGHGGSGRYVFLGP